MPNKKINNQIISEKEDEDNDLIINNEDEFYTEIEQNQNKEENSKIKESIPSQKAPESVPSQKVEKTSESKKNENSPNNNIFKPVPKLSNFNSNENTKEAINEDKTIFSKIAEDLYLDNKHYLIPKKIYFDISKAEEDTYNRLTIENYLFTCADKENSKNNKIISDFLERKSKEQNNKKIGSDPEKGDLENLAEMKGSNAYSDRKKDKLKKNNKYRSQELFLKEQKMLEKKHKEYINDLIQKYHEETKNAIKDRPTISKRSEKLANMIKSGNNKEIHMKLYEDFNLKKQKRQEILNNENISNGNKFKKLKKEEIIQNTKRLYQDYAKRKNTYNENNIKQLKDIMSMSAVSLIEKKSNIIIFKKLINKYKIKVKFLFNRNASEKFDINYNDFLKLLFNLNCVEKDYNKVKNNECRTSLISNNNKNNSKMNEELPEPINYIKNKIIFSKNVLKKNIFIKSKSPLQNKLKGESELNLIKNGWKIICKIRDFSTEYKSNSFRVLLFFLSLYGIFKGDLNENLIKKEFPYLSENLDKNDYIDETMAKQIYKYFQMFRNSAINYFSLKNKEKDQEKEKRTNIIEFKTKMPKGSKSFIKTIDYSNKNDKKIKKYFSSSISSTKIKIYQKDKNNLNKYKTINNNNDNIDMNEKDKEDIKEIMDNTKKEINIINIIKDDDNIPNLSNNNYIVNRLKNNLKPKYEIKKKKLKLDINKASNSTKNINSKINKSVISNKNNKTASHKDIKENLTNNINKKNKNNIDNNISNLDNEITNQNQKIILNNKIIRKRLPKVQMKNTQKVSEESNKVLTDDDKNTSKEQNIIKNNNRIGHQKEKNSSISNYIFNEDYRIKEDIESNLILNNLEENEKNGNEKLINKENINVEDKIEKNQELKENIANNVNNNEQKIAEQKENNINEKKKKNKFVFKIKIKKKLIKLIINKGDNIELKIDAFCKENNLDENDKKEILDAINSSLNE